ncbi:hypothetical protein Bca101_065671 [Brassica carinata]
MSSDLGFILITTVTAFLSYSTNALLHSGSVSHGVSPRDYYLTTDEHWFNQTLDHYSPHDYRKFRQRYYEYLDNFRAPDGPVFMIICGEGPCSGIAKDYMSESLNVKLNRSSGSSDNPWFFFGVSYPGALSAWFRLKFPHLTCGSLASSAVVHAVYDFSAFDQQIGESAGQDCKAALQETNKLLEIGLKVNGKAVKALFNATELHVDADFLYLTADAAVMAFQYGNSDKLCVPLVKAKKNGTYPEVDATNLYYGGHKIAATKIIFTNGSQDPWRHASRQTSSPELPSYIMDCHNCGHGTDLRGCPQSPMVIEGKSNNCSSSDAVNKVRQQMVEHIDLWLSECRGSTRSSN